MGSVTVTLPSTTFVGMLKSTGAVPVAEASGVEAAVLSQFAVAVLVPLLGLGAELYVQLYGRSLLSLGPRVPLNPLVSTTQVPPLSTVSVTPVSVMDSQSLGLLTVIVPLAVQPLSVPASCVTVTV